VVRVIFIGCLVLLFGCASKKAQEVKDPQWTGGNGAAPPSVQRPDPVAARESNVAPIPPSSAAPHSNVVPIPSPSAPAEVPPPLEVPAAGAAATGKMEQLGEMSDSTPGAADVTQRPCDLDNCAVVLAIGTHEVAESVDQDDGGPGTYIPQGMYSAETASQPGVWDAYGVQKIIRVWDISVLPRGGGAIQVIQQRSEPLFRVGDPVLVNGNTILPWN
jgi:hypothetical protein